jgi:hypothetical protein
MKIFNRKLLTSEEQSLSNKARANKIERDRIRNEKMEAKIERTRAQTRIRERNGGISLQLKFAEKMPEKKRLSWRKSKASRAQSKRAKKQRRGPDGRFLPGKRSMLFRDVTNVSPKSGGIVSIEYKKKKVQVGGSDYYIPVDKDGYVPRTVLASRLQNITEGGRKPDSERNVIRDLNSDAETIIKGDKLTPEDVKHWWAYPNESDIEGIDTTKDWANLEGYSAKKYNSAKKIVLLNVSKTEDAAIRKVLMDSFTKGELDKMSSGEGVTVVIDKNISSAGAYDPVNKTILLSPEFSTAQGTITHEFIHHLRLKDKNRKGEVTKSRISVDTGTSDEDRNLEESATTAETVARVTPYRGFRNISYYWDAAKGNNKDAYELRDRDRELFVGNINVDGKGLRGKRAVNSVEQKFDSSEISKLKMYYSKEKAEETLEKYRSGTKK